jgi:hypothetical protein
MAADVHLPALAVIIRHYVTLGNSKLLIRGHQDP